MLLDLLVDAGNLEPEVGELPEIGLVLRELRPELDVEVRGFFDIEPALREVILDGELVDHLGLVSLLLAELVARGVHEFGLRDYLVPVDDELFVEGGAFQLRVDQLLQGLLLALDLVEQIEGVDYAEPRRVRVLLEPVVKHLLNCGYQHDQSFIFTLFFCFREERSSFY